MTEQEITDYIQQTEAWKQEMEQKLEAAQAEICRADDYRQIMNAMAAHSFGYNSQAQKKELDEHWVKSREDIYYNGHTTQAGVYAYYVDGTKEIRDAQRRIINRVYAQEIPDSVNVGYRVMNMLTTPYIEIAADRKTAKGCWMTYNLLCRVNDAGVPEPNIGTAKMTAEFINENGRWKLWRFRECGGGFELDTGLRYDNRPPKPWQPMGPGGPPTPDSPAPEPYDAAKDPAALVNKQDWYVGYNAMTPTIDYPKLPEPYDHWTPEESYFEFVNTDNPPVE